MGENKKRTDQKAPAKRVDPSQNPGPRGNQEIDPRRLDLGREDLERLGAN